MPVWIQAAYLFGMLGLACIATLGGFTAFMCVFFAVAFSFQFWTVYTARWIRLEQR